MSNRCRIMKEMCDTCIFRPGNPMHLDEGRLESMVRETDRHDSNVICHQSEGLMGNIKGQVWCKGSVDRRAGQLIRIAERLGMIKEVDPPRKESICG
jgi:hypothetical protein